MKLLAADEPPPFIVERLEGRSPFVIAVDHASARIPRRLGYLGLPPAELKRHIAWDIGAIDVARRVAADLDATVVAQNYSRLVIDCNRDPHVAFSIPTVSEYVAIPGNASLSDEDAEARRREIFRPYHDCIRALLDERRGAGRPTILVALHSMTDVFKGLRRDMHASVMYHRDRRFAEILLNVLRNEPGLIVAENDPYAISDETDYSLRFHGEARALPCVQIEVRQDLIQDGPGQIAWAGRISVAFRAAARAFAKEYG